MATETNCCDVCQQMVSRADMVLASSQARPSAAVAGGFTVIWTDTGARSVYDCGAWRECGGKKGQIAVQIVDGLPVMYVSTGAKWVSQSESIRQMVNDAVYSLDVSGLPGFCVAVNNCAPASTPTPTPTPAPTPVSSGCTATPNSSGQNVTISATVGSYPITLNQAPITGVTVLSAGITASVASDGTGIIVTVTNPAAIPSGANGSYWSVNVTNNCGTSTISGNFS